ncbi:MAG: adenylyltransferase/cytidyltransferase family protein [Candidatus Saccharibacteria bacterium]
MPVELGIFGNQSNYGDRLVEDYGKLARIIASLRELHPQVVVVATSGTYDLLGIGHARYLEKAKQLGDILVVGVDSDAKTKRRKGNHRPIVDESERMEMLTHLRSVDIVTLKTDDHKHLEFLSVINPDILVISSTNEPSADYIAEVKKFCKDVVLLEPQAKTSTTTRIRNMQAGLLDFLKGTLIEEIEHTIQSAAEKFAGKPKDDSFAPVVSDE